MVGNEATWSQPIFGVCDLDDSRRTRRLVDVGGTTGTTGGSLDGSVLRRRDRRFAGQ